MLFSKISQTFGTIGQIGRKLEVISSQQLASAFSIFHKKNWFSDLTRINPKYDIDRKEHREIPSINLPGSMFLVVMATGLSCPGKSREGRDRTGQDLETLKVPWSCGPGTKEVQKSRDFFWRSRGSPASFPGQDFAI